MRKVLSLITILLVGFVLVACGRDTYTVTFESNGGTAVTAITDVAKDATIAAPTAPTRAGFVFAGWFKESTLVNQWNFATDKVTANITLYAKWDAAGPTDQQAVDTTFDWLSIGDLSALTNQSPRLILPTVYQAQGVNISWVIDKLAFIAANGVITQPTHEEGTQTVTLTATLTKGSVTRTKVFTATVLALPPISETIPLINETFNYANGDILTQSTIWGPVSGKTGTSLFSVVDSAPQAIPGGSKALKIEAFTELQIEAPIAHTYDLVVIEVDLLSTTTSNGSPINIQSSSSSPVIGFGLEGAALFWRVDNLPANRTENLPINIWYRLRAEVNLANKTLEVFYYANNGQLVSMTPGPVTYQGTTSLQSLFIRSGSSTTTALRPEAYVTNLVANRIEAMPRPTEIVTLGEVSGIRNSVSVPVDGTFTPDIPSVRNVYGSQRVLIAGTDYSLSVDNPVNLSQPGIYEVIYTLTNSTNNSDILVVKQEVIVYALGEPNEIISATATMSMYPDRLSNISLNVVQPDGELYYYLSNNSTETLETILSGSTTSIESSNPLLENIPVGLNQYAHFVIVLNGNSNIFTIELSHQEVVEISTPQQFYDAVTRSQANQLGRYLLITSDIDFTGFNWPVATINKLWTVLDGNNHTLSNLTINKTVRGGIFSDVENATIKNLVLLNIHTSSNTSASGLLIGEARGTVVIDNVVVIDSSNTTTHEYAGLLVGRLRNATGNLSITNITVVDSYVTTTHNYAGGLVAGMDVGSMINISDIYLENFRSYEATSVSNTGQMNGILIGRIQGNTNIERVVAISILVEGVKNVGGLVGKSDEPGVIVIIKDIYIQGEILFFEGNHNNAIVGNVSDHLPDLVNVWTTGFELVGSSGLNVTEEFRINISSVQNQVWWQTNVSSIASNDLWMFGSNGVPVLSNQGDLLKPLLYVVLDYNIDLVNDEIQVREGNVFNFGAPLVFGYNFVGWFLDADLTNALPEGYAVTQALTLYGKYEALPTYTVSFETSGGSAVADITGVFENATITQPVNPTRDGFTFEGWYKEAGFVNLWNFATDVVTSNTTLYAKWEEIPAVTFTVTFESHGGTAIDPVVIGEGLVITAPATPVKEGFIFVGWFKEVELTNLWDFDTDTVTANITLYAKWDEILPTEIQTAQEFYDMTISGSDGIFLLMNDIDFTGFTWTPTATTPPAFKGTLEGNGFVISNINIQIPSPVTDQFGGIFSRVDGAVIRDLFIHHITVNTTQRAGTLVGRAMGAGVLIENIVVKNASVQSGDANGTGGLVALISANSEIYNVAVVDSTINSGTLKNAAGLVGRVDGGILYADDIFISNVTVTSNNTADSDVGVGAIVGYVRNSETSKFSGVRLVATNVTLVGKSAGALAGYVYFPGTIDVMDAYFNVTFSGGIRTGLIGYWRAQTETLDQSTIFVTMTGNATHSQTLQPTNVVSAPSDLEWWNTNLSAFVLSDLWTVKADGSIELALLTPQGEEPVDPVTFTVTFNSNGGSAVAEAIVEEGALVIAPSAPTKDGYTFDGWYKEVGLINLWDFAVDTVTADVTLFAGWTEDIEEPYVPVGTPITTPAEFMAAVSGGSSDSFYLANHLDFTGVSWVQSGTGTRFLGTIDGNFKTISNLIITGSGTGVYGGIFQRTGAGATLKNLTIQNASIDVVGRVGLLVGRVEVNGLTIENVSIINASVKGTDANGVGLLIGNASLAFTASNVRVINSTVESSAKNVGVVAGRADDQANLTDIFIQGVEVLSTVATSTDQGVSALIGYTNHANANIVVNRVVIQSTKLAGRSAGSLVGYFRLGNLSASHVFIDVEYTYAGSDGLHGIIGRKDSANNPVIANVYNHVIGQQVGGASVQLGAGFVIASLDALDQAWWDTNIAAFSISSLWTFNGVSKFYQLG